jgi:hypothetical protein
MVIFQTPDGNPGYNQFETLDEAVRFVEKLRNEQSVETARMFALEEVKFDFKPYFRVELDPPMVGTGSATESPLPSAQNGSGESPSFTPPSPPAPPSTPATPSVSFGEPPAPPTVNEPDSPVGPEPATVGAATPPPPTFMAPPAPPQANEENQTTRRGLFGR